MNVSKAIELKQLEGDEFLHADPDELDEADRLSIEALIRVKLLRTPTNYPISKLLPGETEE